MAPKVAPSCQMHYLQLPPESALPSDWCLSPYRAVVVIHEDVSETFRVAVSEWLVASGCLYMMAWGKQASLWDDSVDVANLEACDYNEIPVGKNVITTWHDDEGLEEVFQFSKRLAIHPDRELKNTVILDISNQDRSETLLSLYANA